MLYRKVFFCLLFIMAFSFGVSALNGEDLSSKSAVVMNADTNEAVFEKASHERRSMASTTKIMTAIIAAESGRIYETVNITPEMCGAEGTSIGLKAGNKIRLLDLIYGMMLESGNDAANSVAIFLSGSKEAFAKEMNKKAKEIGMTESNFVTASGLQDEKHYTTAYDMALLGSYAVKNPLFREACSSKTKKIDFIEPDITVTFSNHNRLLRSYDGAFGIKTGFTKKSGRCLVSAAERDGVSFVAVTLSAPDDWNDHRKLLDFAFESAEKQDVYPRIPKTVKIMGGTKAEIEISCSAYPIRISTKNETQIKQRVYLPAFVYAPIKSGEKIGKFELVSGGKTLKTVDIIANSSCDSQNETYIPKKSLFQKIKDFLRL